MNKNLKPVFSTIAAVAATCFAAMFASSVRADTVQHQGQQELRLRTGDVIVQKNENGSWDAIRILMIDKFRGNDDTAHCLTYQASINKPDLSALRNAPVRIWHAPIRASSFGFGWELLGNETVSKNQFVGFIEYLKQTDFPRYITFTGQDSKVVVQRANEHYKHAYALGDKGKRTEAISEYSKAIELFPLFYEAIDNRAFTYMELGNYKEALNDFEQSLRVNPDGMAAFFSKGECLMRLGKLSAAEAIFNEGLTKFPAQRETFSKFLTQVRSMKSKG